MPVQRNASQRVGNSPEWNAKGEIFELPATSGTAVSLEDALQAAATAAGVAFTPSEITGLLISVANTGNKYCYLRTSAVLGAAATGQGIYISTGNNLFIPYPRSGGQELLYETASSEPIAVIVYY